MKNSIIVSWFPSSKLPSLSCVVASKFFKVSIWYFSVRFYINPQLGSNCQPMFSLKDKIWASPIKVSIIIKIQNRNAIILMRSYLNLIIVIKDAKTNLIWAGIYVVILEKVYSRYCLIGCLPQTSQTISNILREDGEVFNSEFLHYIFISLSNNKILISIHSLQWNQKRRYIE